MDIITDKQLHIEVLLIYDDVSVRKVGG